MMKRTGGNALRWQCSRRVCVRPQFSPRKFTSSSHSYASASGSPSTQAATSPLGTIAAELDRVAPRFEIQASQVEILESPSAFYETLKSKIRSAKRRVYLSTLYIGKTEHELISTIDEALSKNPELKVSILTDALRGTRETPNPSCASLLVPLVAKYGKERVEIRMYHTPNLTGLRKKYIPKRINEGWGLQHMKLYGFDDEIMLSGANLSDDYFTNRLDRYHLFSSKELTDYYARIHQAACSLSFDIVPNPADQEGYLMEWPASNNAPNPLTDPRKFISGASTLLDPLIQPSSSSAVVPTSFGANDKTYVYPIAQFTPLLKPDNSTEYPSLTSIFRLLVSHPLLQGSKWLFTAGYFNMHPTLSSLLIKSASSNTGSSTSDSPSGTVLTASPWANGFYKSPGVSGMLPDAYTHLSLKFLNAVFHANRHKPPQEHDSAIQLREWRKGTVGQPGGWTYHAKGIWIMLPKPRDQSSADAKSPSANTTDPDPSVTVIGSSNYTKRSYTLDLEVGAIVCTSDAGLQRRLGQEVERLKEDTTPVTREHLKSDPERQVSLKVRLAMWFVSVVGGAL